MHPKLQLLNALNICVCNLLHNLAQAPFPCLQYLRRIVCMPDKADGRGTAPISVFRWAQVSHRGC